MRSLHLEKKGIRCLAIAESFRPSDKKSILCGLVMRRDLHIDGFVFGSPTITGDDSTATILKMFDDLKRLDINCVLISGLILSLYNIVDIKKLYHHLQIPIIGIAYSISSGIESTLKHHFSDSQPKIYLYQKLGPREQITLHTSHNIFIRMEGCTKNEAIQILNSLTIQGSRPEPLRIAKLLAHSIVRNGLTF